MSYHRRAAMSLCRYRAFLLSTLQQQPPQQLLWETKSSSILRGVSPQQRRQSRSIFSYITDLFRGNKDDKSDNPILVFLKQHQQPLPLIDKATNSITTMGHENKKHDGEVASGSVIDTTTAPNVQQTKNAIDTKAFPKFTYMKPSHVLNAYKYVEQEQLRLLQQAVDDVQDTAVASSKHNTNHHSGLLQQLDTIIRWVDTIQQPYYTLRQITSFMCTVVVSPSSSPQVDQQRKQLKSEWYAAIQSLQATSQNHTGGIRSNTAHITFPVVATTATTDTDTDSSLSISAATLWQKLHVELYKVNQAIEQLQSNATSEHDRSNLYASQYLMRNYIDESGVDPKEWFLDENDNKNASAVDNGQNESVTKRYNELSEILMDIRSDILDIESTAVSLSSVKLIYSYLGIRTEQAKLLGYHTIADQIFGSGSVHQGLQSSKHKTTTTDLGTVRQLHVDMAQRLLPVLRKITDKSRRAAQPKLALESYLASSKSGSEQDTAMKHQRNDGPTNNYSMQQYKMDLRSMIHLEHHVTLTGALQFSSRLIQDIFGISIVESSFDSDNPLGNDTRWDRSVRLFHCYDTLNQDEYIGSIYIDPFQRKDKMSRPVTVPIVARSEYQDPIVCISLTLEVPTWDTNPAMMKWDDCEALLHELGHALQFVMAKSKHGCVLGPQSMPFDISELVPKFMELWMTQRSSIYALIDMSKSITPLSDDEIDSAYRVKAREKILKLAELTFYGTLELELFSNFDIKGSETILALQERIAEKIIPHIDYDKNDMTALLDILEDNVHGRQVAWYRYLFCEVHAATSFEHMMHVMSTKSEALIELRMNMRQYLLEPGANIDYQMFQSKLSLDAISIDPLWKLHMLSDTDEVTIKI